MPSNNSEDQHRHPLRQLGIDTQMDSQVQLGIDRQMDSQYRYIDGQLGNIILQLDGQLGNNIPQIDGQLGNNILQIDVQLGNNIPQIDVQLGNNIPQIDGQPELGITRITLYRRKLSLCTYLVDYLKQAKKSMIRIRKLIFLNCSFSIDEFCAFNKRLYVFLLIVKVYIEHFCKCIFFL